MNTILAKILLCALLAAGSPDCIQAVDQDSLVDSGEADLGLGLTVVALDAGGRHNCAIVSPELSNETFLKCWGGGGAWLGLGHRHNVGDQPGEMGDNLPFVDLGSYARQWGPMQVASGKRHTCTLLSDMRTVICWGWSGDGATGRYSDAGARPGQMGDSLKPVKLGLPIRPGVLPSPGELFVKQIVAGGYHTCALLSNGRVKCWGLNWNGQLGYGDRKVRGRYALQMGDNLPYVDLGEEFSGTPKLAVKLSAGLVHTCAEMTTAGEVRCWGMNSRNQLGHSHNNHNVGDASGEMGNSIIPVQLPAEMSSLVSNHLVSGRYFSCVFAYPGTAAASRSAHCFGVLFRREKPTVRTVQLPKDVHFRPSQTGTLRAAACAGDHHACAVLQSGQVVCWGDNQFGQLGVGDKNPRGSSPNTSGPFLQPVPLPPSRAATDVACGGYHTCVVLDNGLPYCFGRNNQGQLGVGSRRDRGVEPGTLPPDRKFGIQFAFTQQLENTVVEEAFRFAANKWGEVITSNLLDLDVAFGNQFDLRFICGPDASGAKLEDGFVIDDLLIAVNVNKTIDGVGGTKGYSRFCIGVPVSGEPSARVFPRVGMIVFEEADVEKMAQDGTLQNAVLHEVGHVLGIGTFWDFDFSTADPLSTYKLDLVSGKDSPDPRYTGLGGIQGLRNVGGDGKPKVEAEGGTDVALRHWDGGAYPGELMTGYLTSDPMPLSAITAKSLTDLGYSIRKQSWDRYSIAQSNPSLQVTDGLEDLSNDVQLDLEYIHIYRPGDEDSPFGPRDVTSSSNFELQSEQKP